ncbi:hypothetical protein LOTGIDRAFT_174099 [Lottia gigantea]|uniref:Uncharacterized protein n=1 Tax=Lottia gigantea TaxID=225164 RepID=V4AYC0_LOTGI|nr:hypothetical protein LOTGIDRAFT_174099 [Lottia gigantea]ESO98626.1 hypothetical protein LOTGIDRAFT_174099 [Lottia gigantea]
MSDLFHTVQKESWAYVGLLGFLLFHLGIILCVLAFEGAIEQNLEIYVQVIGVLLLIAGPVIMVLSAYIRNKQRKRIRWIGQKHVKRTLKLRVPKKGKIKHKTNVQFSPKMLRDASKAKVSPSPWYSDSSGPLPDYSSNRNIEAWIIEHHYKKGVGSSGITFESFKGEELASRLSSLV